MKNFFELGRDALEDVDRLIKAVGDVTVDDVVKYLYVSGLVLQKEAYKMIAELEGMDQLRKLKRMAQITDMLTKAGALLRDSGNLSLKQTSIRARLGTDADFDLEAAQERSREVLELVELAKKGVLTLQ